MNGILMKKRYWLVFNLFFFIEHFLGRKIFVKYFGKWEKSLIQKIKQPNTSKTDFKIIDLAEGAYKEPYIDKRNPIIFRGAAKDWQCCKQWSMDYFKNEHGEIEVTLQDNVGVNDRDNPNTLSKLKMREYIEQLQSGSKKYLKFSRVINDPEILSKFLKADWLKKFKRFFAFSNTYYFFIGGKDTKTPIHNGFATTVFVQVEGKKKWIFYQPEDRFSLGVRPERRSYYYSHADPHNVNDPKFPLLANAKKHEIILNPGDVLWLPPLVFHQVENITDAIGVAFKFVDIPLAFKSSKIMALLFFLSTKPSIFAMFIGARTNENDYIFTEDKDEFKLKPNLEKEETSV